MTDRKGFKKDVKAVAFTVSLSANICKFFYKARVIQSWDFCTQDLFLVAEEVQEEAGWK